VLTFRHGEGSLEGAVEELKSRGVEFPAEIPDHDWDRVATLNEAQNVHTPLRLDAVVGRDVSSLTVTF
jgi:hypothetical protein